MKRNGLFKNIIAISVGFGAMVLLGTNSSKAVLQSNGNDGATYNLNDWMMNVRKMEELGGAMGLSETVGSNLTSSNGSNNIDVHMQKNTEYGALAILSASSYGNPNKINSGETTTGNATGVVMKLNMEWVAAGYLTGMDNYKNAVLRYKNFVNVPEVGYGTSGNVDANYEVKAGDAIDETKGWHGSNSSEWIRFVAYYHNENQIFPYAGLLRSYSGSIFSYNGYAGYYESVPYSGTYFRKGESYADKLHTSRAVIVQGDGV